MINAAPVTRSGEGGLRFFNNGGAGVGFDDDLYGGVFDDLMGRTRTRSVTGGAAGHGSQAHEGGSRERVVFARCERETRGGELREKP